jgi:ArsR family transcriptional regulator
MKDLAARFAALADPTRLEMLALLLSHDELCVCDFVEGLGITQSKASRHLRTLYHAGLLDDRRAGLWVHYRVAPNLDPERKALLAVVRRIFEKRDLSGLERRLEAWFARSERAACKVELPPRSRVAAGGKR